LPLGPTRRLWTVWQVLPTLHVGLVLTEDEAPRWNPYAG